MTFRAAFAHLFDASDTYESSVGAVVCATASPVCAAVHHQLVRVDLPLCGSASVPWRAASSAVLTLS